MADSIIASITDYFLQCPLLEGGAFRVNALSGEAVEYNIETGVFNPVLKQYIDGTTERQYQFNFVSREFYSMDRVQNIQASEFYERLAAWVEGQDRAGIYPDMPDDCCPESLAVLSSGYIMDISMLNAKYQIQLMLTYLKYI